MGFNFGAFAGGLATAIQTQQKLNLEEDKYNAEIKTAQDRLKLEGDKLKKQQEEDIAKAEKDRADGAVKVEEVMGKTDIGLEARINQANNMSKIYKLGTAKTMISDPTSGEKFVVDIPQEHLPTVDGIQKDLDIYKNEGNFKIDNTGALYTRPNAESEFTPIGFKGTNAKAFTKEDADYGKGLVDIVGKNGKPMKVTNKEYMSNRDNYTLYEKPKDSTVVNVMGEGKPIELADQFGEYYANKDTGEPIKTKDGKIAYKKLNEKTSKTIESIDQSKKTIASLNNMVKILDKNPEAVGSIGENPYEYVANYANDILGIPTKELANRTTIQGASGVLAAMTRKIYENGVMTDKDYQRYQKLIPDANDSEIVFRNKAKILISDLNSQVKKTEERYSKTLPDFVSDEGESAIAPYEDTPKTEVVKAPYGNEVQRNGKNYIWDTSRNKYILKP